MMIKTSSGLGYQTVAVVSDPGMCPQYSRAIPITPSVTGANVPAQWECVTGEPWYCEWFGIGCQGPVVTAPPAPETEEQMTQPGEWTPDQAVTGAKERYDESVQRYYSALPGVATVPSFLVGASDTVKEILSSKMLWIAVGAAAVIAAVVAAKRV